MKRRTAVIDVATLSPSLRALNAGTLSLVETPDRSREQRHAQAHGERWEDWIAGQHREALRRGIVACLDKIGPPTKRVGRGLLVATGKGPVDYLGTLADGRTVAIEAKHLDDGRLYLDGDDRQTIPEHQAAYLDAVADCGAVALLVVELAGVRAAIPWLEVPWRVASTRSARRSIGAEDVTRWTVRGGCYLAEIGAKR